eukprot:2913323-Amphidinium_carterae.1
MARLDPVELASLSEGNPSSIFKVSAPPLGLSLAACKALSKTVQSLTTLLRFHSSRARTRSTAQSSALKTDCRQPGNGSQA